MINITKHGVLTITDEDPNEEISEEIFRPDLEIAN